MELLLLPLLSTILLLCLILLLSLKLLKKSDSNSSNHPAGKNGWPFLGETLEFLSAGRKGTPEKFFNDRMHRHSSKIFTTSLFCEQTAVLCGAAGNKFLFSNDNKLVTAWWPRSVDKIFPSSVAHTSQESINLRRLVMSSLKPDSLQNYVGIMDSVAKQHLDTHWDSDKDVITVLPLAKKFTFALACRLFLSIHDPKHIARFEEPFTTLLLGIFSVPINFPGTPFNRAIRAADLIRKELLEIIKQRKQEMTMEKMPNRDILTHMLTATDENGLFMSELDVADKVIGVLIGGHDTASTAITFIVKYLAELPEIYQRVLKEQREVAKGKPAGEMLNWDDLQKMKYSWNVACEVMRLAPPFQGNFREAIADFTYAGFSIPKGWKLYWNVNTTHKNPDYFPEPEKFDPSRFEGNGPVPYSYVPFGGGPRMCPGKEYARLEILTFMHNLVTKFKWEKVLQHEKIVINHMPMPANGLPVRMRRHL